MENTQETKPTEKIYDTVKICKIIREKLKERFPKCKFSVRTKHQKSITVSVMKTNFKLVKDFKNIPEDIIETYHQRNYRNQDYAEFLKIIKERQESTYHQINHYSINDVYDSRYWNNGVFLTEQGHNFLKEVSLISNEHNWDNSDIQTDYFDVNYYFHLEIGQYDKPYQKVKE